MNTQKDPFYEIEAALTQLRQQTKTRRKFPQKLWGAIIRLTQTHSIQAVSLRLKIHPTYLKQKIKEFHKISPLDFREISVPVEACSNTVSIELVSDFGVRAKIQGPLSCLNYLSPLFRR
jgi:hypothetical protein